MKNHPLLFDLLNKISKKEIRQLKKFVRSPFITHRADLSCLFNYLSTYLYHNKPLPPKADLFHAVYGAEDYDDQKLRSAMSDLHLIIEKFLKWSASQKEAVTHHLSLAATYRQRNLDKHFKRTMKKVADTQEKHPFRNPDYYQNKLRFQIEQAQFQTTNQRTGELNLQAIGDTMDALYLSQKLRHVCTQLSHRAVYKKEYQFGLLDHWIDVIESSNFLDIPAIALYYYCYRFLTEAYSQSYFRKFRKALSLHQALFPQEELKDLYRAAINFCIRKLNEGSLDYTREGWELFQEGLAAGFFIENNQLSRFTFDNIAGIGLRLKEYMAVAQFIQDYQLYLAEEYRESTVIFNLTRLEYERKNYEQALTYLQQSFPKDLVKQLISKTLLIKIYFETEALDLLEAQLDSFRLFIRRREVSDFHRHNFQNVILYTKKIMALAPYDRQGREKLKAAIQQEEILSERAWLLEKL